MRYKNLYLGFVFLSVLAITGAFFITNAGDNDNIKEPKDIPLNSKELTSGQISNQNSTEATQNSQPQTNGLSVQGIESQPRTSNQNQLPTPEQFNVYEEYSSSESPLYIDTVIGTGKEAKESDNVAMLYKGYLTNGQLFDQSRLNEDNVLEAFGFTLGSGQVIPGWEATIPGMKAGGSRRLIIPSQFGYGPSGQGQIPPNSILIFDVDLVAVE